MYQQNTYEINSSQLAVLAVSIVRIVIKLFIQERLFSYAYEYWSIDLQSQAHFSARYL